MLCFSDLAIYDIIGDLWESKSGVVMGRKDV